MPAITVAVVIPTLNEEATLRQSLSAASAQADELIVSDAGSTDATCHLAAETGARVVTGARGRGPQMNLGARHAESEVLLFLHADTRLPEDGVERVRQAVSQGSTGGGFLAKFDDPGAVMRLGSWLVNLRTRWTRLPLGDQAQFATRKVFDELGGFADWPILEDLDFIRRLQARGGTTLIRQPVTTSARRYRQNGVLATIVNNWTIWMLFALGVEPARLAERYRQTR